MFYGQAQQDKFVTTVLKGKIGGTFLEIGSNDPIEINNTYLLEKEFQWRGIMVEMMPHCLPLYREHRPKSIHVIQDATTIDYKTLFATTSMPANMDYLQIDLEISNGSTLACLELINAQLLDSYKFATITFEHDIYHAAPSDKTRDRSREIFTSHGYQCVFADVNNCGANPYEDWYVHPDLVDMTYVAALREKNIANYKQVGNLMSIDWNEIVY